MLEFEKKEKYVRQKILKKFTKNVNCFRYHLELIKYFPEGEPYYDGNHVRTLINGRFYDKRGMCMYPMKEEKRIYEGAFDWGDINHEEQSLEDRVEFLEKMIGIKHEYTD